MIERSPRVECRNCGREVSRTLVDRQLWCTACRTVVLRRSARWARGTAMLATLGFVFWLSSGVLTSQRFLVLWMLLVVALYVLIFKIVRRIAFEIIRNRGVPAPEPHA